MNCRSILTTKILQPVQDAAVSGKCSCFILIDAVGPFEIIKMSPIESKVIREPKTLGYNANIGISGHKYVPRGLANDASEGRCFRIMGFISSGNMNELIQRLVEQANAFIVEPAYAENAHVSEVNFSKFEDLEKFVELIVDRCT